MSSDTQVAIVTGASSAKGMGFAIAKQLATEGKQLVLTDLASTQAELDARVTELAGNGATATAVDVDVTKEQDIKNCVQKALDKFGRIDILVNNAGIGGGQANFLENQAKDFSLAFNINVLGVAQFCQAVIPTMLAQSAGTIVNIASLCGLGAIEEIPAPYTASKFAAIGLTKAIALQYAEQNIRCNAVCPGVVNTQMRDQLLERLAKEHDMSLAQAEQMENNTIAMKRGAEPEEVASVVAFLTSPAAQYMTGVAIPVAGGLAAGL